MKKNIPKRIAIIGLPGSGKSTFAIELGKVLTVPVHHLDRHMFEADGKKKDKKELLAIEQAMVGDESWIVEGCSMSTLGTRFARADTVVYFRFSRLVCIWRVLKRFFNYNEALSKTGCTRQVNWRLLKYIWNFKQDKGPDIEKLRKQHPNVDFLVLKNSMDAMRFIGKFKE